MSLWPRESLVGGASELGKAGGMDCSSYPTVLGNPVCVLCVCVCVWCDGAAGDLGHASTLVSMRNLKLPAPQPRFWEKDARLGTTVLAMPFTPNKEAAHIPVGQGHVCRTHSTNSG